VPKLAPYTTVYDTSQFATPPFNAAIRKSLHSIATNQTTALVRSGITTCALVP
jgi:hypothetical protein